MEHIYIANVGAAVTKVAQRRQLVVISGGAGSDRAREMRVKNNSCALLRKTVIEVTVRCSC